MSVHWPILRTSFTRLRAPMITDDRREYRGIELLGGAMHLAELIDARCSSEVVGVLLPSSGATAMCALASWISGRAIAPLNFLLTPDELQYVIDDSEMDLVLTSKELLAATGHAPRARHVVELESLSFEGLPPLRWPTTPGIAMRSSRQWARGPWATWLWPGTMISTGWWPSSI